MKLTYPIVAVVFCAGIIFGASAIVYFQNADINLSFPAKSYLDMIESLKAKDYVFQTLDQPYIDGKVVYLVHCADYSFKGAITLATIENEQGIKSTFMIRPDSTFFPQTIQKFLTLQAEGWKLGYEYDCLSRANGDMTLAATMFQAQINYLTDLGFNLCATDAHGDIEYNGSVNSNQIAQAHPELWTNNNLVNLFGNFIENATYLSDSSFHKVVLPSNLADKVIIELHTDWW